MVLFTFSSDIYAKEFKLRSKHEDVETISGSGCDRLSEPGKNYCLLLFITFPGYLLLSLLRNRIQYEYSYTLCNTDFSACVMSGTSVVSW